MEIIYGRSIKHKDFKIDCMKSRSVAKYIAIWSIIRKKPLFLNFAFYKLQILGDYMKNK